MNETADGDLLGEMLAAYLEVVMGSPDGAAPRVSIAGQCQRG